MPTQLNSVERETVVVLAALIWNLAGCATPTAHSQGLLSEIATQHQVFVAVQDGPFAIELVSGTVNGQAASAGYLPPYICMLQRELAIYPPGCLHRVGVHSIVLCEQLRFDDQERAAIPVWEFHTYCLDIALGVEDSRYPTHALHHDLYHIFDYFDDGLVYEDNAWAALNVPSFTYGNGGSAVRNMKNAWQLRDDLPGFVTPYAKTGVEEDKAETFAHLITNYAAVMALCQRDRVIANKVALLKAQLEQAGLGISDAFWAQLGRE